MQDQLDQLFSVYAVFPAGYAPGDMAEAIFPNLPDAQFYIEASEDQDRADAAGYVIEHWEVSNLDFMRSV